VGILFILEGNFMKRVILAAVVAMVAASTGAAVHADTLAFNQGVAVDGTGNLYTGTGNPNGDFATSTGSTGAVLGLRADIRQGSLITGTDSGSGALNLYSVPYGYNAGLAKWDFVYSIDVTNTGKLLSAYTATLTVTAPGGGSTAFNPLLISDNNGPRHPYDPTINTIAQNSENIVFGGGNPNLLGQYTFDMTLTDTSTGTQVAEDKMFVDVVPTPLPSAAGMGLAALGVIGAAALLRKKLRAA
jgi:hypothetical protein